MSSISSNQQKRLLSALQQLESQIATIRNELSGAKMQPSEPKEDKPKRELSAGVLAWNKQVHETLAQMKVDGWRHPQTGKEPIYRDALAEAARLRGLADPAIAAKQAEQKAKKAELKAKKTVSSGSSVVSEPSDAAPVEKKVKKNPWADMTEEQKAERVAKMKAGREAKKLAAASAEAASAPVEAVSAPVEAASAPVEAVSARVEAASDAESATSSVKKRGPPKGVKLSDEERLRRAAKAKATRDAKKATAKATNAAAIPLPASAPSSVIVSDDDIDDETFTKQQLPNSSRIVYRNGLNHVRAYTPDGVGAWLGMYDPVKKTIDASVPEPEFE